MKTDKTAPASASEITASGRPFSNRPKPPSKPLPLNQTKKKKSEKEASLKSLKEDITEASESTAHGDSVTTPKQVFVLPTKVVIPANAQIKTPIFDESILSPIKKEVFSTKRANVNQQVHDYFNFNRVNANITKIQADQSKQISLIRKLRKQKWISIFDTLLIGFTLIFFTVAFFFVFHVNPILEMKITPEFQSKVQSFLSKENFKNCQHFSWLASDKLNPSIIDVVECFDKFEYGRIFFETFKSSTPNSSDECSVDRVEVHQCYTKNASGDPMNIFWGVNNTNYDFICNGSKSPGAHSVNIFSFNPPVQKYALIDKEMQSDLLNRIVLSTAFFFQCPKCSLVSRISPPADYLNDKLKKTKKLFYEVGMINSSIPCEARYCVDILTTNCQLDDSRFVKKIGNSFSRQVLNFTIVEDSDFCV